MIYVFGYLVTVILAILYIAKAVPLENTQANFSRKVEYSAYLVALIVAGLGWPVVGLGYLIKLIVVHRDQP